MARTACVAVPPQLSRAAFAVEVTDARPAETIDRTGAKIGAAADNKRHAELPGGRGHSLTAAPRYHPNGMTHAHARGHMLAAARPEGVR